MSIHPTRYLFNETLNLEAEFFFLKDEHVWDIFSQIVKGLQHIHSKGIRHGDLKPSNIFMRGERIVKIEDFGLDKRIFKYPKL